MVLCIWLETNHCLGLRREEQSHQTLEGADVINCQTAEIEISPKSLFGGQDAWRGNPGYPTEPTLPLHALQQAMAHPVGGVIKHVRADPRDQAVLQGVMAEREVFLQIGTGHLPSIYPWFLRGKVSALSLEPRPLQAKGPAHSPFGWGGGWGYAVHPIQTSAQAGFASPVSLGYTPFESVREQGTLWKSGGS